MLITSTECLMLKKVKYLEIIRKEAQLKQTQILFYSTTVLHQYCGVNMKERITNKCFLFSCCCSDLYVFQHGIIDRKIINASFPMITFL